MEPAPAGPRHEAFDRDDRLVHKWRLALHTALRIPSPLAQATADRSRLRRLLTTGRGWRRRTVVAGSEGPAAVSREFGAARLDVP